VHCAAYTDVEGAESDSETCMTVNYEATKKIVDLSIENGIRKFLYVSTNYVFDGIKQDPYEEKDIPRPLSIYGTSKYLGEKEVQRLVEKAVIVRTSAVFGTGNNIVNNFVDKILNFARSSNKREIKVINDELVNPTYALDLAYAIKVILAHSVRGVFHVTNSGEATWYDFAKTIVNYCGLDKIVAPISVADYECKAKRPKNGLMVSQRLKAYCGLELRPWQNAVEDYLFSIGEGIAKEI
jgi:dTDP-4-dehydrorhamnose reductase